jgi:hypothetical protein
MKMQGAKKGRPAFTPDGLTFGFKRPCAFYSSITRLVVIYRDKKYSFCQTPSPLFPNSPIFTPSLKGSPLMAAL